MMKGQETDLSTLLERASKRSSTIPFEGYGKEDRNVPGNLLIVESATTVYSFANSDIMEKEQIGEDRIRVWVRAGSNAFRMSRMSAGEPQSSSFTVAMENIAPPTAPDLPGMPRRANGFTTVEQMEHLAPPAPPDLPGMPESGRASIQPMPLPTTFPLPTTLPPAWFTLAPPLSAVGSHWAASCMGGDTYANNCAHYLSDAFMRAGYLELYPPNAHINARCGTSALRPIRARDMWSWFRSKATTTSHAPTAGTGWWAVFQLKEAVYWGGHVALLDSDSWRYYGTGWYPNWDQYLYQW
ncbi:hypothetical protein [Streptomyces sp. SP18CS02]|uniref:hypothetical protein n=1 Tax=Streptomyces sp. SP18CS02 TaxID=3002531 RepID=UPI002E76F5C4|nr:hypothetical protein [Streptomyces sp. SP18CS02]MEE1752130.1 hypothetical protein [Streptomyces sp. SP18CS02]